jgi:soluble lytic murein transglycosylase-like protein
VTALKVAAVFWALLLSGAARADSADRALSRLCPHAMGIAPQIEAHARRQLLHPALLVALIAHESGCRESAFSGKGDYGLGQIRVGGSAAHGASVEDLLKPERNIELTARHLVSDPLWRANGAFGVRGEQTVQVDQVQPVCVGEVLERVSRNER